MTDVPKEVDQDTVINLYTKMLEMRLFEEKITELYTHGLLSGAVHSSVGQEAVAAGVCRHLRREDYLFSTHRGHGHCIAKEVPFKPIMAELFGKRTGLCKGKGGSMHLFSTEYGLLGTNGIVGSGLPQAVGAGLSIKRLKQDLVSVCIFGDGAVNTGQFHESMNLASLWKLPVIFVCENNLYGGTVPIAKSTPTKDLADHASGYNMPGVIVDGMDVLEVYRHAGQAIERARQGGGPTMLEFKTYRYMGYSRADPPYGLYRTREEVVEWRARDPVGKIEAMGILGPDEPEAIRNRIAQDLEDAVKYAQESPLPEPEMALEDVYA